MKIICIAKNYADHATEMHDEAPEKPIFFLKPDSALLSRHLPFFYPDFSNDIQYELEVVVRINRVGKSIAERFASRYYGEVALGIDFTARDLQRQAKDSGQPWTLSKGFDASAVLGSFVPLTSLSHGVDNLDFFLLHNGVEVQHDNTRNMLFSVDGLISYVSHFMTLKMGDLIYTGTPAGVGSVKVGDTLEGFLEGERRLSCRIK